MNSERQPSECKQFKSCQLQLISILIGCLALVACDDFDPAPVSFTQSDVVQIGSVHTLEIQDRAVTSLPNRSPDVDNRQKELGRLLFWDPILSGDKDVACATCHLPEAGYSDRQHQAIGVGGNGRGQNRTVGHTGRVQRNSQSVLNTAWNGISEVGLFDASKAPMFWDNRVSSLEKQALEPIKSRQEMRGDNVSLEDIESELIMRLSNIPEYQRLFEHAFGDDTISMSRVTQALASFQRSLVANQSPFDRWMRGDENAMTAQQLSGMQEFVTSGCADCHSGPMFSDFSTHVLGVQEGRDIEEPDSGEGEFAFRTPSLRQLSFTAPYFHAGQFSTLRQAIEFYDQPNSSDNPNVLVQSLDPDFLDLPEMEGGRASIIEDFLNALNDDSFDRRAPEILPSGLLPGGFATDIE